MPTDPTPALVNFALNGVMTTAQYIYDIRITPGVNTVRVSFRTVQPTIPVITCTASDGTVSFAFPLFGGMRTEHAGTFGEHKPLQQATAHTLKIVAAGTDRSGRRIERKEQLRFRTGSRDATVTFDTIKARNDSDAGGDGDLQLFFVTGDADSREVLGDIIEWPYLELNDSDPPHPLNVTMEVPQAPQRLWVRVLGIDWDPNFPLFPSFEMLEPGEYSPDRPFEGERSVGGDYEVADWSSITRAFDLVAESSVDTTFPIELRTADHALAFTVNARIRVRASVPAPISRNPYPGPDYRQPPFDLGLVNKPRMVLKSQRGSVEGGHGYFVGMGAEGAIYYKPLGPARTTDERDWMRVPGEPNAPVKAFVDNGGQLNLFAYDDGGSVMYFRLRHPDASWLRLGGEVTGPLAVAESPSGQIDVFGLGEENIVYHTLFQVDADGHHGDWRPIGEKVKGSLAAFAFAHNTIGLFALGLNNDIVYKLRRQDEWDPDTSHWKSLGRATGDTLLVLPTNDANGVTIATLGENDQLRYLEWPNILNGRPPRNWVKVGPIEDWLRSQPPRRRRLTVDLVRKGEKPAIRRASGVRASKRNGAQAARGRPVARPPAGASIR